MHGRARGALPHDHRLALIRDADRVGRHAGLGDRIARRLERAIENVHRVVLDPAGTRIVLRDLAIPAPADASVGGQHEAGAPGGALIDGQDVLHRLTRSALGTARVAGTEKS